MINLHRFAELGEPELKWMKLCAEIEAAEAQHAAHSATARQQTALAVGNERDNSYMAISPIETGDLLLVGAITPKTVDAYMEALTRFHDLHRGAPLRLRINSPGGSVTEGFALFDLLLELKRDHPLTTVAYGVVASMGGILFQAGHERLASPHAHMLIHEGSIAFEGSAAAAKDMVEFGNTLRGQCLDVLAERSELTRDEIGTRWERRDWWLDAEDMVEFGFADGKVR